jgi:hypothetical protein
MENIERFVLVAALIVILILMPNLYWRIKIWLLNRQGLISQSDFLRNHNLRRDQISDVMKGLPRINLKSIKGEFYIDRDTAKLILERVAATRVVDAADSTKKAALGAAAGAAIAAVMLTSSKNELKPDLGSRQEATLARRRRWEELSQPPPATADGFRLKAILLHIEDSDRFDIDEFGYDPIEYSILLRSKREIWELERHGYLPSRDVSQFWARVLSNSFEIWMDSNERVILDNFLALRTPVDLSALSLNPDLLGHIRDRRPLAADVSAVLVSKLALLEGFEFVTPTSRMGKTFLRALRIMQSGPNLSEEFKSHRPIFFDADSKGMKVEKKIAETVRTVITEDKPNTSRASAGSSAPVRENNEHQIEPPKPTTREDH